MGRLARGNWPRRRLEIAIRDKTDVEKTALVRLGDGALVLGLDTCRPLASSNATRPVREPEYGAVYQSWTSSSRGAS